MKKHRNLNTRYIVFAVIIFMAGTVSGYLVNNFMQPQQASPQAVEKAKNEIAALFNDNAVDACWKVNDGSNLAAGKYELTYRNIQINKQANRAIVTDCSENSTLLAKNRAGTWDITTVNISLFNRANPVWQKECGIQDITVADDVVRPENGYIDEMNLAECKKLHNR